MSKLQIQKTNLGKEIVNCVNSRDIHKYLKLITPYNNWIRIQIQKGGFIENIDYAIKESTDNKKVKTDYIFTLEAASRLCQLVYSK